jgi:hypothetical protein
MECPACSNEKGNKIVKGMIEECGRCGAIFGECYLGESYSLVLPGMSATEVPLGQIRYFDFTTVGSAGLGRRHGWYNPATKLITQVG